MVKWLKCFSIATLWIVGGIGLGAGIAAGASLSPTIAVVVIVLAMIGILTALIHWEPKGEEAEKNHILSHIKDLRRN